MKSIEMTEKTSLQCVKCGTLYSSNMGMNSIMTIDESGNLFCTSCDVYFGYINNFEDIDKSSNYDLEIIFDGDIKIT